MLRGFPPGAPQDALGKAQPPAGFPGTKCQEEQSQGAPGWEGGKVGRYMGSCHCSRKQCSCWVSASCGSSSR